MFVRVQGGRTHVLIHQHDSLEGTVAIDLACKQSLLSMSQDTNKALETVVSSIHLYSSAVGCLGLLWSAVALAVALYGKWMCLFVNSP